MLYNLHRKMLPKQALAEKAEEYVKAGFIDQRTAHRVLKCIEMERGTTTHLNDGVGDTAEDTAEVNARLSPDSAVSGDESVFALDGASECWHG